MAKVRHLLRGIVRLNMRGTSPERFLNLCTLAGLNVWQVKKEQENLLFYMEIRDFKRCAPLARKAGVRLHIVEKRGLPVFLWRNRKRKGWAVSFLLFFLLLLFLAQFIWEIDWSGNLMTIAPFVENSEENRGVFKKLYELYVDMKRKNIDNVTMNVLSMGMTGDYQTAIEEGATMVRVGTGIFGTRAKIGEK